MIPTDTILIYLDEALDAVFTLSEIKRRGKGGNEFVYTFCLHPRKINVEEDSRFSQPYSCVNISLPHQISAKDLYLVPDTDLLIFEDENVSLPIREMFLGLWRKQYPPEKLKEEDFMKGLWKKARKLIEFVIEVISHERVNTIYLLKHTQKVVDYGVFGMDVFFDNVQLPCRIEDILDVKDFIRWAIPNFKAIVDITPEEYKQLCVNWIRMAEKGTIVENPLTDQFTESFINEILRSKIYYGWNQDGVNEIYAKKEARVIFVVANKVYIPAITIQNLANMQRTPVKIEKVREILKDFYITSELKHLYSEQNGKRESFGRRFWVFDWEKLKNTIPNLGDKNIIVDENNIPEINRLYKRIRDNIDSYYKVIDCTFWYNFMKDLIEYINKYNLNDNEYAKAIINYINDPDVITDCNLKYAIETVAGFAEVLKSLIGST